jgi:hypothetical protein
MFIGLAQSVKELIKSLRGLNVLLTDLFYNLGESLVLFGILGLYLSVNISVCIGIIGWVTQNLVDLLSNSNDLFIFSRTTESNSG